MIRKIGDRLVIVGVAHILPRSAEEVEKIIAAERPDIVAVELDPLRYMALTQGWKPGILDALRAGPSTLLLSALILLIQGRFSRQTGMEAGEEMLAAIRKARQIGAQVQLIDRDIGITLQRLVGGMSTREKLRLFANLMLSLLPVGKGVEIERLTEEQMVENLLGEFKKLSSAAYDVLISERDAHMSTKLAAFLLSGKKVICVVGAGHVPGICDRLSKLISNNWGIKLKYRVGE